MYLFFGLEFTYKVVIVINIIFFSSWELHVACIYLYVYGYIPKGVIAGTFIH